MRIFFVVFIFLAGILTTAKAQTAGFTAFHVARLFGTPALDLSTRPPVAQKDVLVVSPVYLPRFSESDLPVFCRIEHQVAKKLPLMVKFRLGSVDYVDWLEGKRDQ